MGLFDSLFKKEKSVKKELPWIELTSVEQLDDILNNSEEKTQIIFKHSTRCGISRMVIERFVAEYPFTKEEVDLYYLDLLNHRDVSNAIAEKFQVWHESPQLIVLKNREVVSHASHSAINEMNLQLHA